MHGDFAEERDEIERHEQDTFLARKPAVASREKSKRNDDGNERNRDRDEQRDAHDGHRLQKRERTDDEHVGGGTPRKIAERERSGVFSGSLKRDHELGKVGAERKEHHAREEGRNAELREENGRNPDDDRRKPHHRDQRSHGDPNIPLALFARFKLDVEELPFVEAGEVVQYRAIQQDQDNTFPFANNPVAHEEEGSEKEQSDGKETPSAYRVRRVDIAMKHCAHARDQREEHDDASHEIAEGHAADAADGGVDADEKFRRAGEESEEDAQRKRRKPEFFTQAAYVCDCEISGFRQTGETEKEDEEEERSGHLSRFWLTCAVTKSISYFGYAIRY